MTNTGAGFSMGRKGTFLLYTLKIYMINAVMKTHIYQVGDNALLNQGSYKTYFGKAY